MAKSRRALKYLSISAVAATAITAALWAPSASAIEDATQVKAIKISDNLWRPLNVQQENQDAYKYRFNLTEISFPWIEDGWKEGQRLVGHIRVSSIKPDGSERDSIVWQLGKPHKQNCASDWRWEEPTSHPYGVPSLWHPGDSPECYKWVMDGNNLSPDWGLNYRFDETFMWVYHDPQGPVNDLLKLGSNTQFADLNMKEGDRLMIRPNMYDEEQYGTDDDICDGILYTPPLNLGLPSGGVFTYEEAEGTCSIKWWGLRVNLS
ncbi:hypothetical protein ACFWB2_44385 [Streptomyces virginiae]|uniref:hypothetical protein n=1 Tax=Streptomyces virginiae TaxID=1961 RepID=UPI0036A7E1FD